MGVPMLIQNHMGKVIDALDPRLAQVIKDYKLVLAGGFIRDVVHDEEPKDIDLFLNANEGTPLQMRVASAISETMNIEYHHYSGISTFVGRQHAVQLIVRRNFGSPIELIDGFDLTMAQVAMWVGDNGWESVCGPCFYPDANEKILRLVAGPERTSVRRLYSFFERGWKPPPLEEGERMKEYPDWDKAVMGAPF